MRHFKYVFTSIALATMVFTVFLTGTASAQATHRASAHQAANPCSSQTWHEFDNLSIYSGSKYLGYVILWIGICSDGSQTAHTQTISRVGTGSNITLEADVEDPEVGTGSDVAARNVSSVNSNSIPFTGDYGGFARGLITIANGPSGETGICYNGGVC